MDVLLFRPRIATLLAALVIVGHACWRRTYHRTMTQEAAPASVAGDFDDVELTQCPVDRILAWTARYLRQGYDAPALGPLGDARDERSLLYLQKEAFYQKRPVHAPTR